MISNIFSSFAASESGIPMLMLLAKATLILVVALGITLGMQRASAGARHLVWLVTLAALLLVPALMAWAPIPIRVLPATARSASPSGPSVGGTVPTGAGSQVDQSAEITAPTASASEAGSSRPFGAEIS